MGSVTMCVSKILLVLLVAGHMAWTTGTTQVPILQFVDTQNTDGSYTYGFQSGDGTYKLETRFPDGHIIGKYGYLDPQGVLREASYGAEANRGFEPIIAGVNVPPPTIVTNKEEKVVDKSDLQAKVGDTRIVKASPAPARFLPEAVKTRDDNNKQRQASGREESQRSFNIIKNSQNLDPAKATDPYLSVVDLRSGSFSLSYGK